MQIYEYGTPNANIVLVQVVDEHDLEGLENEVSMIKADSDIDFRLVAVKVDDWNKDLSPWEAPAVFGKKNFGNGAHDTLDAILAICNDQSRIYCLGGYSLAGLFALWVACQTKVFSGIAAASPSVWFPGFTDYIKENKVLCHNVYLSLGDKEKTRNPAMAVVGDKIRETHNSLQESRVNCILEWNEGNHFADSDVRTAKAFTWLIKQLKLNNNQKLK